MATNYSKLVAFAQKNKSNPLGVAKVLTAWTWAALKTNIYGAPTSAEDVANGLGGSCGWRDIMLESIFSTIGVEHRRVNFYDVAFQVNHTATELFIGGKWMFFDSSFGIFFTKKGSNIPLSIAEARAAWPNIEVKQSLLPSLQGKFIDPNTISKDYYGAMSGTFNYLPSSYAGVDDRINAEIYNLYFGPKAYYADNGYETIIPTQRKSTLVVDATRSKPWLKFNNYFDKNGKLDAQYAYMDDKSHVFTHFDPYNKQNWYKIVTNVTAGSVFESRMTYFDDGSRILFSNDASHAEAWANSTSYFAIGGKREEQTIKYDDGSFLTITNDIYNAYTWSRYDDTYNAAGGITTTIYYDDSTVASFDWAVLPFIAGDDTSQELFGTAGTDRIVGYGGNDTLYGAGGVDRLEGGLGNDVYFVDHTEAFVIERAGEGIDTVVSSENFILGRNVENLQLVGNAIYGSGNSDANQIKGNAQGNSLNGLSGNDSLYGLEGNDTLSGGYGNDTLEGGDGADSLHGGEGADVFAWRTIAEIGLSKNQADVVLDFSRAQGDILNFRYVDANSTVDGNQAFAFVGTKGFSAAGQIRYVHSGTETLLYFNTDGDGSAEAVLRIAGLHKPDKSWFIL